jgi:membrane protein
MDTVRSTDGELTILFASMDWMARLKRQNWRDLGRFLQRTYVEWQKDNPALFAIAPLMIIGTALLGHLWSKPILQAHIVDKMTTIVGSDMADSIGGWLTLAASKGKGKATVFSAIILYVAATRVFAQLRAAMDMIWDVTPPPRSFVSSLLKKTFKNVLMMLALVVFIVVFFLADTGFALVFRLFVHYLPSTGHWPMLEIANGIATFVLFIGLFAAAYKYVPDTPVAWGDVWPGAFLTSALFTVGKFAIALYLQYQSFDSVYGAAGSVIVLLVWIYFAAQLFFFGAEFTWLYSITYGSRQHARLADRRLTLP